MTTLYNLGYVRELDHVPDEPLTAVSKHDLAPVWSNERREQPRPVTASASRKQAFARITALPLHKQDMLGSKDPRLMSLSQAAKKRPGKKTRYPTVSAPGSPPPRRAASPQKVAPLAGGSNAASSTELFSQQLNLESASSASLISQAMSLSGVGSTSNVLRPRSAQPLQLPSPQPRLKPRPMRISRLHSLPGCEMLPDERKLRLLQQTHMSNNYAALTIQKIIRGKQARAMVEARTSYDVGKKKGRGGKKNDLFGGAASRMTKELNQHSKKGGGDADGGGGGGGSGDDRARAKAKQEKEARRRAAQEIEELRRVFRWMDRNRDGYVDGPELWRAQHALGGKLSPQQAADIVWEQDDDLDGALSWAEFRHGYYRAQRDGSGFVARRFFILVDFLLMDRDFSGQISLDEALQIFFQRYGNSSRLDQVTKEFFDAVKPKEGERPGSGAAGGGSGGGSGRGSRQDSSRPPSSKGDKGDRRGSRPPSAEVVRQQQLQATVSFDQFFGRFGTYLPQPLTAHQLQHSYSKRRPLSPPSKSRPGSRQQSSTAAGGGGGGGGGKLRGSASTPALPMARGAVAGPPPGSEMTASTMSAYDAARVFGPRQFGNRSELRGVRAHPTRSERLAEIALFGRDATPARISDLMHEGVSVGDQASTTGHAAVQARLLTGGSRPVSRQQRIHDKHEQQRLRQEAEAAAAARGAGAEGEDGEEDTEEMKQLREAREEARQLRLALGLVPLEEKEANAAAALQAQQEQEAPPPPQPAAAAAEAPPPATAVPTWDGGAEEAAAITTVTTELSLPMGLGLDVAGRITEIHEGSSAAADGALRVGDRVVSFDGVDMRDGKASISDALDQSRETHSVVVERSASADPSGGGDTGKIPAMALADAPAEAADSVAFMTEPPEA